MSHPVIASLGLSALHSSTLSSLEETDQLGAALCQTLPAGTILAVCGTLGAGKTRLAQAIAVAGGVQPDAVTSPTYTLWHTYPSRPPMHHLDAYRVRDEDEWYELGVEELFDEAKGIVFIEWADRYWKTIPRDALWLTLDLEPDGRTATFWGDSSKWADWATRLKANGLKKRTTEPII